MSGGKRKKKVLQVTLKSGNDYSNFREVRTEDILYTTMPVAACLHS